MLDRLLSKHDYKPVDRKTAMRNYVMFKLFELAESEDEKTSMRALENLAKTNEIGLFDSRIEVNVNNKSIIELESDLQTLVSSILKRAPVTVDAEYQAIG